MHINHFPPKYSASVDKIDHNSPHKNDAADYFAEGHACVSLQNNTIALKRDVFANLHAKQGFLLWQQYNLNQ